MPPCVGGGELLFRIIPEDFPSCYDSEAQSGVLFIHFNTLVRLLPASRASGRSLDAHA
jgi:hypothetical protein